MTRIIVDSREKAAPRERITNYFTSHNVEWHVSKLFVGDYQDFSNPFIVVDRKANIGEIAGNVTSQHDRFVKELERAREIGIELVILIEQNRVGKRKIEELSDICLWKNQYGTIHGERIFRILTTLKNKYGISIEFCDKRSTARRIIEILQGGKSNGD
jgi:ERCC4-type nuclease